MWRARPLSDTAPPKAVPLTHGEARGSVTWTNAVDDEENERRPPEKAAADDFCEPSKTVKVPPSSKLPRPPPKNGGTKIPVDRDAAAQRARVEAECRANGGVVYTNDDGPVYEPPAETRPDAYATFLGSEAYAPGAEALLRSLAKHTKKARVAMVARSVTPATRQRLKGAGATRVVEVENIENPRDASDVRSTKLRVWGLEDYGKVVYLDADCLVVGSADPLFATCRDVAFAAAPALYPPDTFDGGVLVLTPSSNTLEAMLKLAPKTPSNDVSGFLNEFFDDWFEKDVAGQRLPFRYNWRPRPGERDLNAAWPDDAVVAQYAGDRKPWTKTEGSAPRTALERAWWAAADEGRARASRDHGALSLCDAPFAAFAPQALAFPARLRRLYLDRAGLAALPDEICGQFCNLVCLRARGNQLKALPADIVQLTKLEELDVRDNLLKQIPAALAALPLKALRLCGNPLAGAPRGLADRFTERCRAAGRGLPALAETLLAGPRWRVIAAGSDHAAAAWLDECRRECKPGSFPLDDGVAAPATLKALLSLGLHAGKCVDARDFVYLAKDERTGRYVCDPTPRRPRARGDPCPDDSTVNARRETDDDVRRFAYNHRTKWASVDNFQFDDPVSAQCEVLDELAGRVIRLDAALREEGAAVCFVYRDGVRGACGSFVNCPLTGDSLDEDGPQDLVACCELLKKRYPKAKTLIVHLATDPPDVAVSHPSLFSVDVKTVDDGNAAGLLEFCLFGASVGVTDDDYEVPDDIIEDASRARNLSEKARLFDTGKE